MDTVARELQALADAAERKNCDPAQVVAIRNAVDAVQRIEKMLYRSTSESDEVYLRVLFRRCKWCGEYCFSIDVSRDGLCPTCREYVDDIPDPVAEKEFELRARKDAGE